MFSTHALPCEVTILDPAVNLSRLANQDSAETIWIAAGGDGTVNAVASAIAGSKRAMGILPCGTLNHFAQDLGIPLALEAAVHVAATYPPRTVDTGEVNGTVFVNNSSLGVYPAMVFDRERMKRRGGNKWISLAIASARAFLRFRLLSVAIEVDGRIEYHQTPLLFVGNNEYEIQGGNLGRRTRLDEGRLALYLLPGTTRWAMLRLLGGALIGKVREQKALLEFSTQEVTVRARTRRLRVAFDGEVSRMIPPLVYRSRPRSLRVTAPEGNAL